MRMIFLILSCLTAILITGCNKQASVSTESTQSTGFKGEFSQSNTETQSAGKVQRTVIKKQFLTGLIEATQKTQNEYETYFPKFSQDEVKKLSVSFDANGKIRDRLIIWGYADNEFDHTVFSDDVGMREIAKLIKLPDKVDDWFLPLDEKAQKYLNDGNLQAGQDFLLRYWTLILFNWAIQPSSGWPGIKGLNEKDAEVRWIFISTRRIRFANLLASEIAHIMPTNHKNPSEFRHDFVVALDKMSNDTLYQIFSQAKRQADDDLMERPLTIDGVTGRGTVWVAGTKEYNGQMSGWTLKAGGQPVFGNGYIDGQLIETELASSLELTSKIDRSTKRSGSVGTDENAKGSVKSE